MRTSKCPGGSSADTAATIKALRMMDNYPILPNLFAEEPLPAKPRHTAGYSQDGPKSWDYVHSVSEGLMQPPPVHFNVATVALDPNAKTAEIQQRVVSELAKRLHTAVNQQLKQRQKALYDDYKFGVYSGKRSASEGATACSAEQRRQPAWTSKRKKTVSVTAPSQELDPPTTHTPSYEELNAMPLSELVARYGKYLQPQEPQAPSSSRRVPVDVSYSSELNPNPTRSVPNAAQPVELEEGEGGLPAVPLRTGSRHSSLVQEELRPPSSVRTTSAACPMGEVVHSSGSGKSRSKDRECGTTSQALLSEMDSRVERQAKCMASEDVGLVRINRLKGVPKFNRGVFATATKKRGRSGNWLGADVGDRIPSSSSAMMKNEMMERWLCSFFPGAGDTDDPFQETSDNPFSYVVLRGENNETGREMSARWQLETLTAGARARLNARHSRYRLSRIDSFDSLIGSVSALVLAQYGTNLSEEEREMAKRRLRYLRNKEKERQSLLPFIRNNNLHAPEEKPATRPNSAGTVAFNEQRVKLPLGAKYMPGVGFVDADGTLIEISKEDEEELKELIGRLPNGDSGPGTFLALTQEDLDRLEEMQRGVPLEPTVEGDFTPVEGHSTAASIGSVEMGQTMTMQDRGDVPLSGPISVSVPSSTTPRGTRMETDEELAVTPSTPTTDTKNGSLRTLASAKSPRLSLSKDKRSLSTTEDNASLDLFLARFPETKKHVKLRKEANAVLSSLEPLTGNGSLSFFDNPLVGSANFGDTVDSRATAVTGSDSSFPSAVVEPPIRGFFLDEDVLRERFKKETENENRGLTAERNRLRQEVEKQRKTLQAFAKDIEFLSFGDGVRSGDQYAAHLTREVNSYAKANRLRLNKLEMDEGQQTSETALENRSVAKSFLAQFGARRAAMRAAACQVSEEDLGVVDESVKLAEEQMEDLLYHERELMDSIRLATIAVANVMSFHASLELESTCKECFFMLEQPRTLWPCGHTFCQQCLNGMYNSRDELVCAECGSVCDVGYTPNLSVEVIARYQVVQEQERGQNQRTKKLTIEGVLRRLLNDLLASQKKCKTPSPVVRPR